MNPAAKATAESRLHPRTVPGLAALGVAAVLLSLLPAGAFRDGALNALLLIVPAAAALASFACVRVLPRPVYAPCILFGISAVIAAVGQLYTLATPTHGTDGSILALVAALLFFALGTGWAVHQRDHDRVHEIGLDSALIVAAVTVVTLRWSPAAQGFISHTLDLTVAQRIGVFGAPIFAGCAVLFASTLLWVRSGSRGAIRALAIFIAATAFGLTVAPLALGSGSCCRAGDPAALLYILGWLSLAYASICAARTGMDALQSRGPEGGRLRMVIAPAVAMVMGAVVLDTAARGPLQQPAVIAFGVLGVLLAVRVSQLLYATRTMSKQQTQLAQSRALIELSRALSGMTRLDQTLELITRWSVRLLDARAAAIELLSEDGTALELHAVEGLTPAPLRMSFPVEGSFSGWVVQHGRARATSDVHAEPDMHASTLAYLGKAPIAAAPLRYRGETVGALSCVGRAPFSESDLELLGALAEQAAVAIENARLFEQVHQLSMTDPLTGLPNRRQLERDLVREFAAAQRGRRLVVVMFDLNGFKAYNDRHGHIAGDAALRMFAEALSAETRIMNMAARYGGDEFIALLADNDEAGASTFIDRVRARFPGRGANAMQSELGVAAGFAAYDASMERPEDLVEAADRALYEEKARPRVPA